MWICRRSGGPVDILSYEFPLTGGGQAKDAGIPCPADLAADHVHVDHGELAIVGKLRQGKTIDDIF